MMSMNQHLPRTAPVQATDHPVLASWWSGLTDWVTACADSYAASAMYQNLSRLSDAELQRRGLSRANLARDVFKSCERPD